MFAHLGLRGRADLCHSAAVQLLKSRAFFRLRLVIYGALVAYFGFQALQSYKARQGALERAVTADPSLPAGGVKRTATLPNGETIEYTEYELTAEQAAELDRRGTFTPAATDAASPANPKTPATPSTEKSANAPAPR